MEKLFEIWVGFILLVVAIGFWRVNKDRSRLIREMQERRAAREQECEQSLQRAKGAIERGTAISSTRTPLAGRAPASRYSSPPPHTDPVPVLAYWASMDGSGASESWATATNESCSPSSSNSGSSTCSSD